MEDEENRITPDPYEFEFECEDCGFIWRVNTRNTPFEERAAYLRNQICSKCNSVHVFETVDSLNNWIE